MSLSDMLKEIIEDRMKNRKERSPEHQKFCDGLSEFKKAFNDFVDSVKDNPKAKIGFLSSDSVGTNFKDREGKNHYGEVISITIALTPGDEMVSGCTASAYAKTAASVAEAFLNEHVDR